MTRHLPNALLLLLIQVLVSCSGCTLFPERNDALPGAVNGSVATGQYPNLFTAIGMSENKVKQRLEQDYAQLFYGDDDNERVFYPVGKNRHGPLAYVLDVNSRDVRSEGMSYGMMIAVQMDKKSDFDAIWNWALTYMYQTAKDNPARGYFSWSLSPAGVANDLMPAPDGEEYFATALYFAASRWGNGDGIYNYSAYADTILTDMVHRELITGDVKGKTMTVGNMFDLEHAMVRFTPDKANSEHTDASYHLPAFYQIWAKVGPKRDRAFWLKAAQASRDYFVQAAHPITALTPDYGEFDGRPWAADWRPESVDFRYDAWRTVMNWSMDWSWWAADPRQQQLSDRLQGFFEAEGMDSYQSLYTLNGKKLGLDQTTALIAMNATASLAATHPRRKKFISALWRHSLPTGQYRYYDGMLYMFALLHCGGQYKDWTSQAN